MGRTAATLIIWIVFAIILVTILVSPTGAIANASGDVLFGIAAVLAAAAAISTISVWGITSGESEQEKALPVAKPKRAGHSRVDRLMDDLSDDEIYELEARLFKDTDQQQRHDQEY